MYDNTGMEKEHTCLACKLRYKGRYCPRCGQSADTQRFTIKNIFDKTLEVWDYNEKSVFGTVLELIYRPGYLISAQLIFFSIIYMLFWGTFLPDQDRYLLPEWFFFLVYVIDRRQLFGTSWFKTFYKTVLIQVLYYVCIFFIVILSSVLLFLIDSLFM